VLANPLCYLKYVKDGKLLTLDYLFLVSGLHLDVTVRPRVVRVQDVAVVRGRQQAGRHLYCTL